jgi:hypothetical protein
MTVVNHKMEEDRSIDQIQYEHVLRLVSILTERMRKLESRHSDEYKLLNDRVNEAFDIMKMLERKL